MPRPFLCCTTSIIEYSIVRRNCGRGMPRPYEHMIRTYNEKGGWSIVEPQTVRRRAMLCGALLTLIFALLLARLWYLQVARGQDFLAQAQSNQTRDVPISAPRGLILDRNGVVLATSRASHSVAVVPAALPSARRDASGRASILRTLGFLIGMTPAQIEAQIVLAQDKGGRPYDPVRLPVEVDLETVTRVEENKARLGPAVLVTNDLKRFYPNGKMAAHVLGYSGVVTQDDIQKSQNVRDAEATNAEATNVIAPNSDVPNEAATNAIAVSSPTKSSTRKTARELKYDDVIGKIGLEKEYDVMLAGTGGAQQYEVDARGRPVKRRGLKPEVPGHTMVLTLDARLQKVAENALDQARNSGAVAVIDPRNGEVLAIASRPTFDPNIFGLPKAQFQKIWLQLNRDPKHPLINRAVTSRFPPGSTYKMITAAAGLQQGTITPKTSYICNGGLRLGRFFGCWSTHGRQNLSGAIAHSCDVFFYQSALKMGHPESSGPTYLAQVSRRFGLGQTTNLDLPIEAKGLVPDPAWRKRRFPNNPDMAHWFPGNTLNMSIGQGDVLATPLQMALATGAVANGGTLWQPHLLRQLRNPSGNRVLDRAKPKGQSVGIDHKHIDTVRAGMRAVVTRGTGKGVALPNIEVAGKTGSAEDVHNVLPHAWFVAFAPYKNPTIAVAVIVENSGHGSENAVPIARKILEAAFPQAAPQSPKPKKTR